MQARNLKIAMAQLDFTVGAIEANTQKIINTIRDYSGSAVDLIVFPELTITSYPPEDLLFREALEAQVDKALSAICEAVGETAVVLGLPGKIGAQLYNQAVVIQNGDILARYNKWELPNYSVFDEKRYFVAGDTPTVATIKGVSVGITVCEDIWFAPPVRAAVSAGAELVVNLNASPFHIGKTIERETMVRQRVAESGVPIVYVNLVGGQDELVFDGASFVMNSQSDVVTRLPSFVEKVEIIDYDLNLSLIHI